MSEPVLVVAIVVTGLVLGTLGIIAIVFGKNVSASVGPDETTFRADGELQSEIPQVSKRNRSSEAKV